MTGGQTEIGVAYEGESGDAIVVYDGTNNFTDLTYNTWNGTTWSGQQTLTATTVRVWQADAEFTTHCFRPHERSHRHRCRCRWVTESRLVCRMGRGCLGRQTNGDHRAWSGNSLNVAVGFESQSGELLATYSEVATTPRYQTWSSGGGWSGELNAPDIGAYPQVMTLATDPAGDALMLGVQDSQSDLHYLRWDGDAWGADNELTTNTGETGVRPFTFVFNVDAPPPNDAPVLDNSGFLTLTTITEDETNNSGDLVSAIIASDGGDRITDVDAGAVEGIAIGDLTSGNGTWQYNIGSGWTDVGAVSWTSSLLLRDTDSLRFVPDGLNSDTGIVTFAAWDQTSGTAGTKVDASDYGGTTAFSELIDTAVITVTAVNDAPVLADTALSITVAEDAALSGAVGSLLSAFAPPTGGISDVDSGAVKGIAIVGSNETNGAWYYSTNGGTNWTAVGTVDRYLLATAGQQRKHAALLPARCQLQRQFDLGPEHSRLGPDQRQRRHQGQHGQ